MYRPNLLSVIRYLLSLALSPVLLLGLTTIGAYGVAYYSIGVLVPVIAEDTGWPNGALSGAFSLGTLIQGGIALFCGRLFDRHGSRPVLAPALAIGASLLFVSSFAEASWQFVAAWALGAAAIGGGLYYNVTMPVTARLFPEHRAAAFSGLTFLGALASPIFYPLAAWFIDMWGWRGALQALVVVMVVCIAPAALLVRAPGAPERGVKPLRSGLSEALRDATVHRALVVFALAAFANSALLLHQVSIMEAMGLSLAAASGFAGARGFFQIPGRVLLTPLTRWFGVRGLVGICYVFAASATFALLLALGAGGTKVLLVYFTVVSGISLGLLSPLNGLFQAEVYGDARIGTLSGVNVIVVSTSGAIGAWVGGLAVDVTGGFEALLVAGAVLQLSAVAALRWQHAAATVLEAEEPENPRRPRIVAPPSRSRA